MSLVICEAKQDPADMQKSLHQVLLVILRQSVLTTAATFPAQQACKTCRSAMLHSLAPSCRELQEDGGAPQVRQRQVRRVCLQPQHGRPSELHS